MATSFEAERDILRSEAIRAAERNGLDLVVHPEAGIVMLDVVTDAFRVRFWKRTHEGPMHPLDFYGWVLIDCEAVMSARRHPTAARDLFVCELDRGMKKYLREFEEQKQ